MNFKVIFVVVMLGCFVYEANTVVWDTGSFYQAVGNLTKIDWAFAVNNRSSLEAVLNSSVMMIEADVALGDLIDGSQQNVSIVARPPVNTSDLTLKEFLSRIIEHNLNKTDPKTKVGFKLDFKSIDALEEAISVLQQNYTQLDVPVWIHADILEGPMGATTSPVDPTQYFNASAMLENCTVSVGWTTELSPNQTGSYSPEHIKNMANTLNSNSIDKLITFAMRAALAANSIPEISSLLDTFKNSTITIWSGAEDEVDVEELRKLILKVGLNRTYVVVPESLKERLHLDDDPSSGADGVVPLIWACVVGLFLSFL